MAESGVSIIIAAWGDAAGLAECLGSLSAQRAHAREVIVVSTAPARADLVASHPWVEWVEADADRLIPHLWGIGMARARGGLIAITTAHFTPTPGWVEAIVEVHARLAAPAIGGPIDPPRGGRAVDWATYFLRYSAYFGPDRERAVEDLAGDNASYKRSALAGHPEFARDGFWELDFHRGLRAEGHELVSVPAIRVAQRRSFGFGRFLRQRFEHGTQFGRARLRGRGALVRVVAAMAASLVPAIFLAKIVRRVARSGRDLGPFVVALPALLCFLAAWAMGEARGYLLAGRAEPTGRPGRLRPETTLTVHSTSEEAA